MLQIKLLLLIVLAAAGQGIARLPGPRLEQEREVESAAVRDAEAMLKKKREELEQRRLELQRLEEEIEELIRRRAPSDPGDFKLRLKLPGKLKDPPPPQIDDMPPLGPLAAYFGKLSSAVSTS